MAKRSDTLEFAVLGLLHDAPMHGYELRKRLNAVLGSFRAISYGSLYPCLKHLLAVDLIAEAGPADAGAPALTGRRARIVYQLTPEGKERFQSLLSQTGPDSWDDEQFGVHFAFFSRTDQEVRMRILEGRRSRLEERLSVLRGSFSRGSQRVDAYTEELARHGLDGVEREVRWLSELIAHEKSEPSDAGRARTSTTTGSGRSATSTTQRNNTGGAGRSGRINTGGTQQ